MNESLNEHAVTRRQPFIQVFNYYTSFRRSRKNMRHPY